MKLLFFHAPWCTACHAIEDKVPSYVERVDCSVEPELATEYSICSLPMFVAVDSSRKEIARIQSTNVRVIDEWFKRLTEAA